MSLAYYTITPQKLKNQLVAQIFRLFAESGECLETKVFPIRNPQNVQAAYDEADLYGKLSVSILMQEEVQA